jgi:hypothetical protein
MSHHSTPAACQQEDGTRKIPLLVGRLPAQIQSPAASAHVSPLSSRGSTPILEVTARSTAQPDMPRLSDRLRVQGPPHDQKKFWPLLPNLADPTKYNSHDGNQTARKYSRSLQRLRILLNSSSRLLLTIFFCALCVVVLKVYHSKPHLETADAQWFNAYMTILTLFTALNLRSSLQSYMKVLRWSILARWEWPLRQFDLILDAASSQAILKLIWESRRSRRSFLPSRTQCACFAWILLNIAGSLMIALLGLNYSLEQSDTLHPRPGNMSVLDLESPQLFDTELLHEYGMHSIIPNGGNSQTMQRNLIDGVVNVNDNHACTSSCAISSYTFKERPPQKYQYYSPNSQPENNTNLEDVLYKDITFSANRSISATTTCRGIQNNNTDDPSEARYGTIGIGEPRYDDTKNGLNFKDLVLSYDNGRWKENNLATIYIRDTTSYPACSENKRCASVRVLSAELHSSIPRHYFQCATKISEVTGTGKDGEGQLPDASAIKLAAAISFSQLTHISPWAILYGFRNYTWEEGERLVASTLSQFAMSALAAADQNVTWDGQLPWHAGYSVRRTLHGQEFFRPLVLDVNWKYVVLIVIAVPTLQFLALLGILIYANDIVVKDESQLVTARLLAPVVAKMKEGGSLLQINEVVKILGADVGQLRYGWKWGETAMQVYVSDHHVGQEVSKGASKFPEGKYD